MFERIIVTLDGSASSEAALPAAEQLARRLGSSVVLLHVIEARPPKAVHGERHLGSKAEAEEYLASVVARLEAGGLRASFHVHESGSAGRGAPQARGGRGVAESVAEHELELGGGLAVMSAHGRHGLATALTGSLPLKVAASGGAAVLLVPQSAASFAPTGIVLPLDGRPEHEAALPSAIALAKAFEVGIRLVSVVPRSGAEAGGAGAALARLAPAFSAASLDYAAGAEHGYLENVAARIRAEGIAAECLVIRGRPAKSILSTCAAGDLLALSTHRKLGLDASLDGCVAFETSRRWRGAMLIAPIPRREKP